MTQAFKKTLNKNNIYNLVVDFPYQIQDSYKFTEIPKFNKKFNRIVVIGMGGSYIAGLLLKEFLREELEIPIEVYPGELPSTDNQTLIILISYSGNTKEVINITRKIKTPKLILTSGGKLKNLSERHKIPIINIPQEIHQRFTFSYGFFPLIKFFEQQKLIKSKKQLIQKIIKTLKKNKPNLERAAKELVLDIKNRQLLFYATNYFYPAAYRLQTSLEEDAKVICHANKITELFHNELEAFPNKKSLCILIIDSNEIKKFKKQLNFFKKIISYYEIKYKKYSREERIFLIFYFADFLGYYLSKIKHTKMGETPKSDEIKKL